MAVDDGGVGWRLRGVSVLEPQPPLGRIHLELREDVIVLYGLNGAGKSRLLDAIRVALGGRGQSSIRAALNIELDKPWDELGGHGLRGIICQALMARLREEPTHEIEDAHQRFDISYEAPAGMVTWLLVRAGLEDALARQIAAQGRFVL